MRDPIHLKDELNNHPVIERMLFNKAPFARYINREIVAIDEQAKIIEMTFTALPQWANYRGHVQGGFVCAMLDCLLGSAGTFNLPKSHAVTTVEMKTTYIAPTPIGPLKGVGQLVHQGNSLIFTEAKLLDFENQLLATASSTLKILRINQSKD